jgi:lysophospholipase L1-like esterase
MPHGELRCVFFGDSITAGQYVEPEFQWTTILRERVERSGLREVDFSVGAVSGDTTRQGLERLPTQVQELRPQVVSVQFGLNDCNQWQTDEGLPRVSERAFEANLMEMGERARHFGTTQLLLLTTHPTLRATVFDDGSTYEQGRRRYNDIVRVVAARLGARLVDIEEAFDRMPHRLADLLLDPPDVLHLSHEGHIAYADVLEPVLLDALRTAAGQPGGTRNAVVEGAASRGGAR